MTQRAIYPGTFDPMTKGHVDLIERACKLFDEIVIAIAASEAKNPLFTLDERIQIAEKIFESNDKVKVVGFSGLLVDLAKDNGARIFQASTSEVYGDPLVHPQVETYWGNVNSTGLRSCYDEGKRCAETLFFDYFHKKSPQRRGLHQ